MTITEGSITITLYGHVTPEREEAERRIARYRHEQLTYMRPRPQEPRRLSREERDFMSNY